MDHFEESRVSLCQTHLPYYFDFPAAFHCAIFSYQLQTRAEILSRVAKLTIRTILFVTYVLLSKCQFISRCDICEYHKRV